MECQRAREAVAEAHRENEMTKEILESEKESLKKEADAAANAKLQDGQFQSNWPFSFVKGTLFI